MKTSATDHDSPAAAEAALWAARLDGDSLDSARRAELEAWLARDPAHRVLLSRYCQFSADLEEQLPALVSAGRVAMPAVRPPAPARRGWGLPQFAGLGLAAAAAVAVGLWIAQPAAEVQNLTTAIAQHSAHTLADGTRVELNARTSLRFENTAAERRVRLAGGEAWFAVAKDAARPFVVETPAGSVRVTGTTFTVRNDAAAAQALEVIVVEGSVQVRASDPTGKHASEPISLKAGDRLAAGARGVEVGTLSAAALENAMMWREGLAAFVDAPLAEAAAVFGRYHGKRIEVAPGVAKLGVGGRHGLEDLRAFFSALETALPVKVSEDLSGAVVITSRPSR
ncbi:MAG: FecR domain-containing protein [Opitutaceae bacterium]|nr:FecR domain-containing protein [Opitutaceae bacterium]